MNKTAFMIVASILIITALSCSIYVIIGTKNAEKLMWEHLETKGYTMLMNPMQCTAIQ